MFKQFSLAGEKPRREAGGHGPSQSRGKVGSCRPGKVGNASQAAGTLAGRTGPEATSRMAMIPCPFEVGSPVGRGLTHLRSAPRRHECVDALVRLSRFS